ncbi:MAG: hypothetical protein QW472_04435 [Candidatus Aenigmatarchaeota archaeon]
MKIEKAMKMICPHCGKDITERLLEILSYLTGIDKVELENGGFEKVIATFHSAKIILEKIEQHQLSVNELEKITTRVLPTILEKVEESTKEKIKEIIQPLQKTTDEISQNYKALKDVLEHSYSAINDSLSRLVGNPLLQGKIQEISLLKRLKAASPEDFFTNENSTKGEEDILAIVKNGSTEIARISIESKKVKKFNTRENIRQAMDNKNKKNAILSIIATTTMPDDSLSPVVYKEGEIYIVDFKIADIFYKLLRDFIVREWEKEKDEKVKKELDISKKIREILLSQKFLKGLEKARKLLEDLSQKLERVKNSTIRNIDEIKSTIINELEETIENMAMSYQTIQKELRESASFGDADERV